MEVQERRRASGGWKDSQDYPGKVPVHSKSRTVFQLGRYVSSLGQHTEQNTILQRARRLKSKRHKTTATIRYGLNDPQRSPIAKTGETEHALWRKGKGCGGVCRE